MNKQVSIMALALAVVMVAGLIAITDQQADAAKRKVYCGFNDGIITCAESKKDCKENSDTKCEKSRGGGGGGGTGD